MSNFNLFTNISTITSIETTTVYQKTASHQWLYNAWKISTAVTSLFLICSVWISFSFFFYARGVYINRRKKTSYHFATMILTILLPLMMLFRFISTFSMIFVGKLSPIGEKGDRNCNIMMAVSSFLYVLANLPVYILLWLRQKVMYSKQNSVLNNSLVKVASVTSLFLLIFGSFGNWLIFLLTIKYQKTEFGCIKNELYSGSKTGYFSMLAANIISHILLFSLFCYPLKLYWQRTKRSTLKKSEVSRVMSTKAQIFQLAKKALITLIGGFSL